MHVIKNTNKVACTDDNMESCHNLNEICFPCLLLKRFISSLYKIVNWQIAIYTGKDRDTLKNNKEINEGQI